LDVTSSNKLLQRLLARAGDARFIGFYHMKIKVKRYKEIEQLALSEALVKIIKEVDMNSTEVAALQNALKALNLSPQAMQQINMVIATELGLVPKARTTQTTGVV